MTSTPVTNQSTFFMDVTKTDVLRSDGKTATDFSDAMSKAQKDDTYAQPKETEPKAVAPTRVDKTSPAETKKTEVTEEAESKNPVDAENTEQEISDAVETAIMTMMTAVAETLDITVEELESTMQELDIEPASLLDAKEIPKVLTKLTGEPDVMSLVTDENLYESLKTLTDLSDKAQTEIAETLNVPKEAVPEMIKEQKPETVIAAESEPIQSVTKETEMKPAETKEAESAEVKAESFLAKETGTESTQNESHTEERHSENNREGEENNRFAAVDTTVRQFTEVTAEGAEVVTEVRETVDTEMIMRQITDYIRVQNGPEVSEIEMQLHPASLGTVNLQIVAKEGGITAQFFAENESVRAALETQITQLRENLEQQGFRVEAVEVAVGNYDFRNEYGQGNQNQQNESSTHAKSARIRRISLDELDEEEEISEEEEITVDMMRRTGNSVDYLA